MSASNDMPRPHALDLVALLDIAVQASRAGAGVLQSYAKCRSNLIIDHKGPNDLVSQADRQAEAAIIEMLRTYTPTFSIVAEETGGRPQGEATWYIDPLDGTTNFLHGIPHYAVSIGLVAHAGTGLTGAIKLMVDTPVVAVVYDPCREELFTAVHGAGAFLNGHGIQCSATRQLADSVVATGFPFRDFSFCDQYLPTLHQAMIHTRGVRRNGAAALDLAWTACGRFDGYWEMGLASWDVAAGTLLVREAGGIAQDMYGQDSWPMQGWITSGNQHVIQALTEMINPHLLKRM